jgi:tetratricopeptide (TPR) repeat protein
LKLILGLAGVTLALSLPGWGQSLFGSIKGRITDESGPMAGVQVEYYSHDSGRKYTLTTNKKGEFDSIGVSPGVYKVTLSKSGQVIWVQENVQVALDVPDGINVQDFDLPKLRLTAVALPGQTKVTAEQMKKIEEAKKEKTTVETLNQKMAAAKAAEDANQWADAVAILTETTTLDPTRHELWANLCLAEIGAKQFGEAVTHCQKGIDLAQLQANPDKMRLAQYHNNLGQALVKSGNTTQALQEYSTAAQIDPASAAKYYFNLGAVLTNESARLPDQTARFQMIDLATEAFDKAIIADPNYAEAYYQKAVNLLGKAALDKSNKMVAPPGTAEAFNKYLELEPAGRHAEEVKAMLAYIGAEVQTTYGKPRKTK